ncbi:MAG: Crp/Fnr family transcriptional regulator [Candidatus Saccharimonadales bacterium]
MYDIVRSPFYKLLLAGKRLRLPKGQVVQPFGERAMLSLITSGYVKRYLITQEGLKSVQNIYGPNDIFPMTPVFQSIFKMDIYRGPEQYYYESMTDIEICFISLDELETNLALTPILYKDLLYASGVRLNSYIHRLEDRSLRSGLYRTAHLLAFLASQFGKPLNVGVEIQLPLTHQEIGEILDLTRETVSRELGRLKSRGLIVPNRKIIITDMSKLIEIYRK